MEMDPGTREATVAYVKRLKTSTLILLMVNKEAIRQAVGKARGQQYADEMRKEDFAEISDICAIELDNRIPLPKTEAAPRLPSLFGKRPSLWRRILSRLRLRK